MSESSTHKLSQNQEVPAVTVVEDSGQCKFVITKDNRYEIHTDAQKYVGTFPENFYPEDFSQIERLAILDLRKAWHKFCHLLKEELQIQPTTIRAREVKAAIRRHEEAHLEQEVRHKGSTAQQHIRHMIDLLQDQDIFAPEHYYSLESSTHVLSEFQAMIAEIRNGNSMNTDSYTLRSYQSLLATERMKHPGYSSSPLFLDTTLDVMEGKKDIACIPWGYGHTVASLLLLFGEEIFHEERVIKLPQDVPHGADRNKLFTEKMIERILAAVGDPEAYFSRQISSHFEQIIERKLSENYAKMLRA